MLFFSNEFDVNGVRRFVTVKISGNVYLIDCKNIDAKLKCAICEKIEKLKIEIKSNAN